MMASTVRNYLVSSLYSSRGSLAIAGAPVPVLSSGTNL
ncbi:hypothetical protein BVRB_5g108220 [Beta vulgaris subsp. vulgaris]|nr:hypothetical protein BVRB_5g108220 [Beta vulgaris subsp. vulgaris]